MVRIGETVEFILTECYGTYWGDGGIYTDRVLWHVLGRRWNKRENKFKKHLLFCWKLFDAQAYVGSLSLSLAHTHTHAHTHIHTLTLTRTLTLTHSHAHSQTLTLAHTHTHTRSHTHTHTHRVNV